MKYADVLLNKTSAAKLVGLSRSVAYSRGRSLSLKFWNSTKKSGGGLFRFQRQVKIHFMPSFKGIVLDIYFKQEHYREGGMVGYRSLLLKKTNRNEIFTRKSLCRSSWTLKSNASLEKGLIEILASLTKGHTLPQDNHGRKTLKLLVFLMTSWGIKPSLIYCNKILWLLFS